jgi:hypothetical protein
MTKSEYNENFKIYYNKVKFASPEEQYQQIIIFVRYLIDGYEEKHINISDVGAWVASIWLASNCNQFGNQQVLEIITDLGMKGNFFDQGEKRVKEEWGISYEEAESKYISQLKELLIMAA